MEKAGPGLPLLQDLQRDPPPGMTRPIGQNPEGSKADRMAAQSAKIEAGHVHLPRDTEWLNSFLLELLAFPRGKHDDQVDSGLQFLNWTGRLRFFEEPTGIGMPIFSSSGVYYDNFSYDPYLPGIRAARLMRP